MSSQWVLAISRIYDAAEGIGLLDTFGRSWPMKGTEIRIRPYVLAALLIWLLVLGVLGLAPLPELWINDKVLHFFGMGIATLLTYFILHVPDTGPARRVWYLRRAPLLLVLLVNGLVGDVGSELVQGMLPVSVFGLMTPEDAVWAFREIYRNFDPLDILSNILGSLAFFFCAHALMQHGRKRWEIGRLYRPEGSGGFGGGGGGYAGGGEGYQRVLGDDLEDENEAGDRQDRYGTSHGNATSNGTPGYSGKALPSPRTVDNRFGSGGRTTRPRDSSINSLISLDGDPEGDVWNDRRYAGGRAGKGAISSQRGTKAIPTEDTESERASGPEGGASSDRKEEVASGSKLPPPPGLELAGPAVFDLGNDEEDGQTDDTDHPKA